MPRYRVQAREEHSYNVTYEVEANNQDEAIELVEDGDAIEISSDLICIHDIEVREDEDIVEVPDA
jgi:hypothetical protein